MKGQELMIIFVAIVAGYIVSMMVKQMCGSGLVEGWCMSDSSCPLSPVQQYCSGFMGQCVDGTRAINA